MITTGHTLILQRDAELDEHGHVTGQLKVQTDIGLASEFETRERGHGYIRLPPGSYRMVHSKMAGFKDEIRCLRPLGLNNPKHARCLIHPITRHVRPPDTADALQGCVAPFHPGRAETPGDSDRAMEDLWVLLGGWKEGAHVSLVVVNDIPRSAG
jgi:hypothetical protein